MFAPNSIIEKLLQLKKAQAAMTLDALWAADMHTWQGFEISTILAYFRLSGLPIGESIVRRGLFDLSRLGLLAATKIINRSKGRPMYSYQPKTVDEIASKLGVKLHHKEHSDAIPFHAFKTARAYRASKHYSFLARLGKSRLSRKKLGERLGVGRRTTANYEIDTDIQVVQKLEREKLTPADIPFAPKKKISGKFFLLVERERDMTEDELDELYKDFDPAYKLIGRRKTIDTVKLPYTAFLLKRELERGNTVFKAWQSTNEYSV